jgi:hypothetical protein
MHIHFNPRGVPREGLVNGIVDDFIDHVMKARPVIRVADIHARTLANRVQTFENLDAVGIVGFDALGFFFTHRTFRSLSFQSGQPGLAQVHGRASHRPDLAVRDALELRPPLEPREQLQVRACQP